MKIIILVDDFVNKLFTSSRIKEDLKTVDSKSEEYKSLFDEFFICNF